MMRDEQMILKRMVVLVLFATVLFLGYAIKRHFFDASITKSRHLDEARVLRLETLLAAIRKVPESTPSALPSTDLTAECVNSQQILDDISELNRRLDKLRIGESPFLFNRYQLDTRKWFTAVSQEKDGCSKAAAALGEVLWNDRKKRIENNILVRLDWREKQRLSFDDSESVVSFNPRMYATYNPWRSLPGRVLLSDQRTEKGPAYFLVKGANMGLSVTGTKLPGLQEERHRLGLSESSRSVPRGLSVLVGDLAPWRNPESIVYQEIIQDKNKEELPGEIPKEVGLHTVFTIDPELQSKAQIIAECYTGEKKACKEAGIPYPGETLYEKARVRRVGIAVIDIASGEIEVLASSESPCFRHDITGLGQRPAGCMDLEDESTMAMRVDTDTLLNHALFMEAPPASTTKPIVAAGLLADKTFIQKVGMKDLKQAIWKSNTKSFLNWMFCAEKGIPNGCDRPKNALAVAHDLGWNLGCDEKDGRENCGFIDVLFGRPISSMPVGFGKTFERGEFNAVSRSVLLGRFLIDSSDGELRDMTEAELFPVSYLDNLKSCAKVGWEMDEITKKAGLGVVSEGRGQGNSRATSLGVATMMGSLAASAQGINMPYPHLVRDLLRADGTPDVHGHPLKAWGLAEKVQGIDQERAKMVVSAMILPHRPGGTANKGCMKMLGGKCDEDLGLASKTGTPGFDMINLAEYNAAWKIYAKQRKRYMAYKEQQWRLQRGEKIPEEERLLKPALPPARPATPWKWYAGFFNSSNDIKGNDGKGNANEGRYDKAFAVLVERNWHASTKVVDDPGDSDSSAVEIGFSLLRAIRQDTQRTTP